MDKFTHEQKVDVSSDFKTGLVLLVISLGLGLHTLGFPMSGSYGGVENQWYISPALFPLIVCSCLVLLSAMLLIKSAREEGYQHFTSAKAWFGDWQQKKIRDRWYVIFTLVIFVYVYAPTFDFYFASAIFLLNQTSRFYYTSRHQGRNFFIINALLCAAVISIKTINSEQDPSAAIFAVNQDETAIFYSDLIALITLLVMFIASYFSYSENSKRKLVISSLSVLIVPLVLIIIFTFLLYVPMPVEYGSVSELLNYIIYEYFELS